MNDYIGVLTDLTNSKELAIIFGAFVGMLYVIFEKNKNIFSINKKSGLVKIGMLLIVLPIGMLIFILFGFDIDTPKQGLITGLGMIGLLSDHNIYDDFFIERMK